MDDAFLAYMILWSAIAAYFLLASIDFGAGFYHLLSYRVPGGERVRQAVHTYVNPRWEVTNVFLVLIVVAAAAFFPGLVAVLGTVLLIPVSLVVILFVVRGAFLVFEHYGGERRLFAIVYSVAGLLILPLLSVVLTLIIDNPVTVQGGVPTFDIFSPLAHPMTYVTALLVLAGEILLSGALVLHYDPSREDRDVYRFPVFASAVGVVILGLLELSQLRASAGYAYATMMDLLPFMVATGAAFGAAVYLIWRDIRRFLLPAFALVVAADVAALLTFAYAHYPYLIYPDITAAAALTNASMRSVLLVALGIGLLIVVPSLAYLNYLFRSKMPYEGRA